MKKFLVVLTALALVAGFATVSMAGITSSAHDFSGQGWSGGQICLPCHTPHNADTSVTDAPLWNHQVTTATFTLYSSSTLDATLGAPDGLSKLCLSCHDGTVAVDNYGGNTGGNNYVSGSELLGTNMSDDHPISFTYDPDLATADGGLYDPSSATTELGGTIANDLLFSDKMECSSCHDVHNEYGLSDLLKIENDGSDLCLTCHNK